MANACEQKCWRAFAIQKARFGQANAREQKCWRAFATQKAHFGQANARQQECRRAFAIQNVLGRPMRVNKNVDAQLLSKDTFLQANAPTEPLCDLVKHSLALEEI